MSQGSNERFVPSGVNAESWLGFEKRIEERRFRALLDTMNQAIAANDVTGARVAFEEARELRPDAPELVDVELRLSAIFVPLGTSHDGPRLARYRAVSAVLLLLFGIALLMGIDWMRSAGSIVTTLPIVEPPTLRGAAAVSVPSETEQAPVTIVPPPAVEDLIAPEPVATAGPGASYRSASTLPVRPATITRETSDEFVLRPAQPADGRGQVDAVPSEEPIPASQPLGSDQLAARLAATPAPAASAPLVPVTPAIPRREPAADESRVAAVLGEYARAYDALDAGAAREVWPTVNERALARAFAGLASQDVEFDDCAIAVRGTTANASCRGKASYVGKIGSGAARTEARTWHFELRRDGEAWKIESAEARRQ